ncbi:MAG: Kdo hydroxylase family protein [Alphaproteobacteria bacterium]|nr:Kdo hydroxylase family protein [Alphaproteobacteria bacterium]
MDALQTLDISSWTGPFAEDQRRDAIAALESGCVLFLPRLPFALRPEEAPLLTPDLFSGRAKNISLDPSGKLKHASRETSALQAMMQRFASSAVSLVSGLFPGYAATLERARTSYRPVEIAGRKQSPIHDDTRLHVDAFPTRPMRGRRIMRLFSNVHPGDVPRVWNVGEPFADMAAKILPRVKPSSAAANWFRAATFQTRGLRSPYDDMMMGLHDNAKLDMDYQRATPKTEIRFPPGTTWLCYTDQVMHAALSGQFVLEQTFHLDVAAMGEPARAPIRVLEKMTGRSLA